KNTLVLTAVEHVSPSSLQEYARLNKMEEQANPAPPQSKRKLTNYTGERPGRARTRATTTTAPRNATIRVEMSKPEIALSTPKRALARKPPTRAPMIPRMISPITP